MRQISAGALIDTGYDDAFRDGTHLEITFIPNCPFRHNCRDSPDKISRNTASTTGENISLAHGKTVASCL